MGQERIEISDRFERLADASESHKITNDFKRIDAACEEIGRAWSGSNLDYHSTVYYAEFVRPPTGAHFSIEAGAHGRCRHQHPHVSTFKAGPAFGTFSFVRNRNSARWK
jgi:hypothetical protein